MGDFQTKKIITMSETKIVRGNTFAVKTRVRAFRINGSEIQDFDLSQCTEIVVKAKSSYSFKTLDFDVLENNEMRIVFDASIQHVGDYGLDVTGMYNDVAWRYFDKDLISIVETNAEANIPPSSIIDDDYYMLTIGSPYVPYDYDEIVADINQLKASVAALQAQLNTLIGNVDGQSETISTLSGQLTSLGTQVDSVEDFIEETPFVVFNQ